MEENEAVEKLKDTYGASNDIGKWLYRNYKEKAFGLIEKKPYILGHYKGKDTKKALNMVYDLSEDLCVGRIAFYVLGILESSADNGYTMCDEEYIKKELSRLYDLNYLFDDFDEAVDLLTADNEIVREDILGKIYYYLKYYYDLETSFAERTGELFELDNGINDKEIKSFINSYSEINLNDEQKDAVSRALKSKVFVLTGLAGTGKTTVLKAIADGFKELLDNPEIKLVSLSGMAVRRITEAVGLEAQTIHSFLNLKDTVEMKKAKPKKKKIKCDVLIIDEASMISLELFNILFNSISDDCIIIISGDYRQLPSIGAGKVFKDLIDCEKIPYAELKDILRQKSNVIIKNSHNIIEGNGFDEGLKIKKGEFEFIECRSESISDKVRSVIEKAMKEGTKIYDIQVISPQRYEKNGTDSLNYFISDAFNKNDGRKVYKYAVLDSIIQIKNNYKNKVFNGEKGIVIRTETDVLKGMEKLIVRFGKKEIEYNSSSLSEIDLGFCLSVHKMQGSESKVVVIVIDENHKNLSRELLYVAVTRAKEKVIIIGNKEAFNEGVKRTSLNRKSELKVKLKTYVFPKYKKC